MVAIMRPLGEATTSPKGRMIATMLFPLDTSIPTAFICVPPVKLIFAIGDHLFTHCRFNLPSNTNARLNLPNRTLQQEDG